MRNNSPRIGLVHAVQVAMAPIDRAFQDCWPQARRMNLLDDSLPMDLESDGKITGKMTRRIERLAQHCVDAGADAVLFTCSAFGSAIESAAKIMSVPVLKPNEAMFDAALSVGSQVGMLATFGPAVESMEAEFYATAKIKGVDAKINTLCIPEALVAAKSGDYVLHNKLLVGALNHFKQCDVLMLAHFSMAPALEQVQKGLDIPVLTSPHTAVNKLKSIFSGN